MAIIPLKQIIVV